MQGSRKAAGLPPSKTLRERQHTGSPFPSVAGSSQRWANCWNPFGKRDGQEIGEVSDNVFDEVFDEGGTKTAAFTRCDVWDFDSLVRREIAAPETGRSYRLVAGLRSVCARWKLCLCVELS